MKNLFLALAFMLVSTFAFANTVDNLIIDVNKIESLINVDDLDYSDSSGTNIVIHSMSLEIAKFYGNCVYRVQFQTSGGDVIATFTYTYQSDNCSSQHSSLLTRANNEFNELFL